MRIKISILILSFFFFISCKNRINQNPDENYDKILTEKEKSASENPKKVSGTKIDEISFEVKANTKDFADGIQPWASIEKPEVDLPNLINKEKIVISEKKVTVIIDYPLTNEYQFDLSSDKGFTREMLLTEISKHYYKLYEEEENSATVKTVPMHKRTMYNRNQTNGKYGIWGHDIADLVLSYIEVYKNAKEEIILVLGVDS
ncbi:hypothetical protein GJU43_02565 [Flavobacterium sp. LC2016-23]|uniref:hypothetical protein n=1 Tax=Flavobacterium sp. LC2016-23 TaxID=2666330 RepID=UPI0012B15E15|nr:hypothetical protein [Flavobacterium sp. LC2016-23]MRX38146.1 hypothetical protein [Flavobacterium sp. LC2016-23]